MWKIGLFFQRTRKSGKLQQLQQDEAVLVMSLKRAMAKGLYALNCQTQIGISQPKRHASFPRKRKRCNYSVNPVGTLCHF